MQEPDTVQQNPETADIRPYPKGPNFLGIVIGFAVTILVLAALTLFVLHREGKDVFPMKTRATPSQTRLVQTLCMRRSA